MRTLSNGKPLSPEELARTRAVMERHMRDDGSYNSTRIAQDLGISRASAQYRILTAKGDSQASFTIARATVKKERPLEKIIAHRRAESKRAKAYEDYAKLIRININTDGPIGLMVFGDPHIDSPGCDFALLEAHLAIARENKECIFAGNIGDLRDNWIGRLERLYAQTTVSAKETWRLVEWMMRGAGVQWTWLVRGNHDAWAGINDPLDWIMKGGVGVDGDAGVRIAFRHPGGNETRLHARHDFNGHSQFNPLHALKKETFQGFRDHIIVAGHRHIGADAGDVHGDGCSFQMVRVSGYKVNDAYRHTLGLHAKPIHPAALIIVDPDEPDTSRARAFCAPTVEEGADYLDWKRQRYNSRPRKRK